jgi:hypothetical protein
MALTDRTERIHSSLDLRGLRGLLVPKEPLVFKVFRGHWVYLATTETPGIAALLGP